MPLYHRRPHQRRVRGIVKLTVTGKVLQTSHSHHSLKFSFGYKYCQLLSLKLRLILLVFEKTSTNYPSLNSHGLSLVFPERMVLQDQSH
jgi:hypothetical protein